MKIIHFATVVCLAIVILGTAACADGFVKAQGSKLYLDGKEYRAVGVNVPHLSTAYMGTFHHIDGLYGTNEAAKKAIEDAITDADKNGIAFFRFFADTGYPVDTDKLYTKDKAAYWKQMDELVALCKEHHIKLVPSIAAVFSWQKYENEPQQAILDPNSKSHKAAYGYIKELVTRYKDDPTVLMWELTNEGMPGADVDVAGNNAYSGDLFSPGAPHRDKLTREDSLTWDMMLKIYKEQTAFIKSLDPNHLVTSGDGCVRQECTSRRETFPDFKYRNDTLREWVSDNLLSQTEPLDVMSYHNYGNFSDNNVYGFKGMTNLDILDVEVNTAKAAQMPVFIGELGEVSPGSTRTRAQNGRGRQSISWTKTAHLWRRCGCGISRGSRTSRSTANHSLSCAENRRVQHEVWFSIGVMAQAA